MQATVPHFFTEFDTAQMLVGRDTSDCYGVVEITKTPWPPV